MTTVHQSQAVVVDASALIEKVLGTPSALRLAILDTAQLEAPTLIDYEFLSWLRRYAQQDALPEQAATALLALFTNTRVVRHGAAPVLSDIWRLRHTISSYDAAYVSLARLRGIPLVTKDARLACAAAGHCEVVLL